MLVLCIRTRWVGQEAPILIFLRSIANGIPLELDPNGLWTDHGICKSAFILALTCSMTPALSVAFFLARRIFQSRDFT